MLKKRLYALSLSLIMLMFIFDSGTIISGVNDGIQLCFHSVIPALLPFLIISPLFNRALCDLNLHILHPIYKLCRIPEKCGSLLILGIIGGYPIGAQSICQAYTSGIVNRKEAQRLLGFCNNAGPAFIFGMLGPMFVEIWAPWALWGIQIASALITGMILPSEPQENKTPTAFEMKRISFPADTISAIGCISMWVIIFRVIITFLDKRIFIGIPQTLNVIIHGIAEISNGCLSLKQISDAGKRFIIATGFLSFGGLSVAMQTLTAAGAVGLGKYPIGKVFQTSISVLLSYVIQAIFLRDVAERIYPMCNIIILVIILGLLLFLIFKKVVAIRSEMLYTVKKPDKRGLTYVISKENAPLLQLLHACNSPK